MTANAPNSPLFPAPKPKPTPSQIASAFGAWTRSVIAVIFWVTVGTAAIGAAAVVVRLIYVAVDFGFHLFR
jgi:hypothetical protein